jgi:hypothetical protein
MENAGTCSVKEAELSIVVIRADGTREDLGVVASYTSNPLKRVVRQIGGLIKEVKEKLTSSNKCD